MHRKHFRISFLFCLCLVFLVTAGKSVLVFPAFSHSGHLAIFTFFLFFSGFSRSVNLTDTPDVWCWLKIVLDTLIICGWGSATIGLIPVTVILRWRRPSVPLPRTSKKRAPQSRRCCGWCGWPSADPRSPKQKCPTE